MIFSYKKRILSAFLSLSMIGTMVASVPFTASAATKKAAAGPYVAFSVFENNAWKASSKGVAGKANKNLKVSALKAKIGRSPKGASIVYYIYENHKWIKSMNGKVAGKAVKKTALYASALKAVLVKAKGYSLSYSVYEHGHWITGKDGKGVGTTSKKYKIEAIKFSITKKSTPVTTSTIKKVSAVDNLEVDNGTDAETAISLLPTTVNVTLSNNKVVSDVGVTWTAPSGYSATKVGTYTFTGKIDAIKNVKNTKNVKATAKVIVDAASAVTIATLSDVAVSTVAGTAPVLPATVTATYSDATSKDVDVTWDAVATPSYATAGTSFTVSGTVADTTLKATATVTVTAPATPTVTSIEAVTASTAAGVDPADQLPATVTATYTDKSTADVDVTWDAIDASSYATAGTTFTVSGTIAGSDVKAVATVTVTAATISATSPVTVSTVAGTAPVLPATVAATYTNSTSKNVAVSWDEVATSSYATAGTTFTVTGTIADTELVATATVTVTAATVATVSDVTATTVAGVAPTLPATVTVTLSDNTSASKAVTWDTIDPSSYATAGTTFKVSGTIDGVTTIKATATVTVIDATIVSIEAPAAITTPAGIDPSFSLPASLTATYSDKSTDDVDVTWDTIPASKYASVGTTFTVNGTVDGTTFKAVATITVTAATVSAVASVPTITVVAGTDPTKLLPDVLTASFSDGSSKKVIVSWDEIATPSYATAGTFTESGSIDGCDVIPSVTIVVTSATPATPSIVSIATPADVTVANGATPSFVPTVGVTYSDNTTGNVAVTYTAPSDYSSTTAGTYKFTGTIADSTLTTTVNVIVKPALTVTSIATLATSSIVAGDATPSTPSTVTVTYNDGTTGTAAVSLVAPANYDTTVAGTYTFTGTIAGSTLTTTWTVIVTAPVITSVAVATASTTVGTVPTTTLPTTVLATYNNGKTAYVPVTWATIATSSVAAVGTPTITGTVAGYAAGATLTLTVNAATTLAVASVSNSNLKQINVTFNTAVDSTTATTVANYTVSIGGTADVVTAATLGSDSKTVTLTLTTAAAQQASASVTVANVKDAKGNTIASSTNTLTLLDTAVPTAVSATVTGPTTVKVTFSEPINPSYIGTYAIDNNSYSCSAAPDATDINSVDLTVGTTLSTATHTIAISNAKDYAGFAVSTATLNFNYAPDTTVPTVSLVSASQNQVVIKFSKPILTSTQNNIIIHHTYSNSTAYLPASISWGSDNETVTATFSGNYLPTGNATIYVNAGTSPNFVTDTWGNAFVSTTLSAIVTSDTTAPTVTSVTGLTSKTFDVKFSEPVKGAATIANYTLKDSSGSAVAISSIAVDSSDNTLYHFTTTKDMNGGSYSVAFAASSISDASINLNALVATTVAFTLADKVAPDATTITAVTNASDATATKIRITYPETMTTTGAGSVLDTSNYLYKGTTLPTGTTVTSTDSGKTVLITLPTASAQTLYGNTITVGHVADAAGNYIVDHSGSLILSQNVSISSDTITPENAAAISNTTVTFDVAEPLTGIVAGNFTVNGSPVVNGYYTNHSVTISGTVYNGSTVTLVVATANKWLSYVTPAIVATATGTNPASLTNSFGTTVGTIASFNATDKTAPALLSTKVTGVKTIVLTYDEAIAANSVSIYTYAVANNTVTNVAVNTSSPYTVTLTLLTDVAPNDTPALTQAYSITDTAATPNVLAASSTAITPTDFQAPVITTTKSTITLKKGDTYSDSLVGAKTDDGSALTTTIAGPKSATAIDTTGANDGAYTVTYNATDAAKNAATSVSVTVTVDATAPTVAFTSLDSTNKIVTLTFSEPIDAATAIAANFTGTAGTPTVAYTAGAKTLTLTYGTAITSGETVIVGTGVKDVAGNALASSATFIAGTTPNFTIS
jgi:hypothetical protein